MKHPKLRLLVDEVTSSDLEERLLRGDFHVAIGYQEAGQESRMFGAERRVELLKEHFLVALPAGHRLSETAKVALRDLADDDWIVPSSEGFIIEACRAAGFERCVIAVTHGLAARGMVEQGLAVSMAPACSHNPSEASRCAQWTAPPQHATSSPSCRPEESTRSPTTRCKRS
jgi:DNA-binding transcriptional LysR family regulator